MSTDASPNARGLSDHELPESQASFGKYHIFATLGRGGMADVYLSVARGPIGFNKLVVVKRLRANLADEAAFREMFLDEARLAARLNHPNIVNTYEVGEHKDSYYIAMEYLEGQPLNKVLKDSIRGRVPLSYALCARIAADGLAGLHYAHELTDYDGRPLKIIHRDISPHNLFVTYEGQVKVVDFGIAKAALSSTETEAGVLKGKVAYMAPEQAIGAAIDCRADVFSMGVVLWELVARRRLFQGDNAAVTLHKLMNEPIPNVASVVPSVPAKLDAIIAKALSKDAEERYGSALEFKRALEEFISVSGESARPDVIAETMDTLFRSTRDEVSSKIRAYMTRFQAEGTPPPSMHPLTSAAVERLGGTSGSGSGSLITLNASANHSAPNSIFPPGAGTGTLNAPPVVAPARSPLLPVVAVGGLCLVIAVAIFVFGGNKPTVSTAPPQTVIAVEPPAPPPVVVAPVATGTTLSPPPQNSAPVGTVPVKPHTTGVGTGTTKQPVKVVAPVEPVVKEEPGFLTLDSRPWSKVSEGGRALGATPLHRVSLPSGSHTLTLENTEKGLTKTVTVQIKSGEVTTRSVELN